MHWYSQIQPSDAIHIGFRDLQRVSASTRAGENQSWPPTFGSINVYYVSVATPPRSRISTLTHIVGALTSSPIIPTLDTSRCSGHSNLRAFAARSRVEYALSIRTSSSVAKSSRLTTHDARQLYCRSRRNHQLVVKLRPLRPEF